MGIVRCTWIFLLGVLFILFAVTVPAQTTDTDIVVIGAGATGLAASVTAAEGGARVILFEKQPYPGGSAPFTEGAFAVESAMQRYHNVGMTRDEAFKAIMEFSHWRADPRLVRAFVNESAKSIDWLEKQGVEFVEPMSLSPDGPRVWHILKGPAAGAPGGSEMVKILVARARQKGVDLRLATPVIKIIKEGGKISGVIAGKDGKTLQVNAKAVIVATGGFPNNKEWIKKYTGFDLDVNVFQLCNANKMGDGIRMAWDVGAAEDGMGLLQILRLGRGFKPLGQFDAAVAQPNLLSVNAQGKRYCDESIAQHNFIFDGNAIARLRERWAYTIFDDSFKLDMMENGVSGGIGRMIPPGTRLTGLDQEITEALEKKSPNVFMGNTIEELAGKIGVSPVVLKATVDEYNRFCAQGYDELFAKDRKHLRPIQAPKFYAVKTFASFIATLGGIKINEKMEAMDQEERAIPGLYAGGNDVGGLYGDSYDPNTPGETLGFAITSGRIAAQNALKYIGK